MKHAVRFGVAAVGLAMAWGSALPAQQVYPQALNWGSGLVDIPVAWVAPVSGDFAATYSGRFLQQDPELTKLSWSTRVNQKLALSMAGWGRLDVGFAAYSENPEYGFFGKALLLNENDVAESFAHWFMPSVAVGIRNVGPYSHIDRFGSGYALLPSQDGTGNMQHQPDSLHRNFSTANTMYGVASKTWSLRQFRATMPDIDLGLTVGYGNGLFKDDGGLGSAYAHHATGGLFYGANMNFTPSPHLTLTVMGENNAWDYNAGVSLLYRGLRAGMYVTQIGAGSAPTFAPGRFSGDYQKVAFAVGWQSNIFALLHGDFLQRKESALLSLRQGLLAEIATRQQRIAALELEINRYEAQGLLDLEQRRAAAEVQLREERASLERLEDRLRRVEQQLPPDTTPTKPPTQR